MQQSNTPQESSAEVICIMVLYSTAMKHLFTAGSALGDSCFESSEGMNAEDLVTDLGF